MQANHILTADLLDIIFDERNKAYGAYDLRKNYQQRLGRSVLAMLLIVLLLLIAYFLPGSMKPDNTKLLAGPDIVLDPIEKKQEKHEEIKPPPVKPPVEKVRILPYTVPKIVDQPPPEEVPPTVDDIEKAKIGTTYQSGTDEDNIIGPELNEKKGIIEAPKKQDNDDAPFTRVEIESQYPGGLSAWAAYLNRNLSYPQDAADKEIQGTVIIQFIVDMTGNVSDVNAISGPEELRAAAINVIKKSGKWTPAIQNGQKVKSYKKQPVAFRLDSN